MEDKDRELLVLWQDKILPWAWGIQRQAEGLSPRSPPGATFALYCRWGFRAQGTVGGPEAAHWEVCEGQGRKHLSVPSLGSQG